MSKQVNIKIYQTIIFPAVLYSCETWSPILREKHRLRVFEKRVLRKIFGQKRDEVIGGWGKLHNEELHNVYCSPSIIRMIFKEDYMGLACSMHEGEEEGL
jgi:hypothetical protein